MTRVDVSDVDAQAQRHVGLIQNEQTVSPLSRDTSITLLYAARLVLIVLLDPL